MSDPARVQRPLSLGPDDPLLRSSRRVPRPAPQLSGGAGLKLEKGKRPVPYIEREARVALEPYVEPLAAAIAPGDEGELNYAITRLVHEWLGRSPSYATYNAAVGVLECAKLELYRERVAKYEDIKKVVNGPLPHPAAYPAP